MTDEKKSEGKKKIKKQLIVAAILIVSGITLEFLIAYIAQMI